MTKLEAFKKFLEKNNITPKMVTADFPYQNSENQAFIVTHKGDTRYFFFNTDGTLLVQKEVR